MKLSILTLFPNMFGAFNESIIQRAKEKNLVSITIKNIRDFGIGKHAVVDDRPYGGGIGMVMRADVLEQAIVATKDPSLSLQRQRTVLLDARGKRFNQAKAKELSVLDHVILICGHYEGVDERVRSFVDEEISIGDFILTGGEIPAMAIADSVIRLIPGVLKEDATLHESFSILFENKSTNGLLEYPQYTYPQTYKGEEVPPILLSGNHQKISEWRLEQAKEITKKYRPDLLKK